MSKELITMEKEMGSWVSFTADSKEEKVKLYNAMSNPTKKMKEVIGQTILAKDVFCEMITMTDEKTGEVTTAPRVVIIDKDGNSYQAVSYGIFNSLKRIFQVFGVPTWNEPLSVRVKQLSSGKNIVLTLEVI